MNISNALYEFSTQIVDESANDSILSGANIHTNIYEEIKKGKAIRIDDIRSGTPVWDGSNVRLDSAQIFVQFLVMPENQTDAGKTQAREQAENLKDAWLKKVFENPKLADTNGNPRVCIVGKIEQFNDWIKPGNVKIPVCVLRITVNPR